jgi:hypothetical protein
MRSPYPTPLVSLIEPQKQCLREFTASEVEGLYNLGRMNRCTDFGDPTYEVVRAFRTTIEMNFVGNCWMGNAA